MNKVVQNKKKLLTYVIIFVAGYEEDKNGNNLCSPDMTHQYLPYFQCWIRGGD